MNLVAWAVKDPEDDGWVLFHHEEHAREFAGRHAPALPVVRLVPAHD